jgi:hypothetical protein
MTDCLEDYKLNGPWDLWYHSIEDNNWSNGSYKFLYKIKNLCDIKFLKDNIQQNYLQNGMFFIMREDIFPTWEDPDNREGCSVSFKIPASKLHKEWNNFLEKVLTEDILKDQSKIDDINGISISPKREFNILKLWLRNNVEDYTDFIKEYPVYIVKEKSITKKHLD